MKRVNIHEAKTHFSKLLDQVASGQHIIIAKAGNPVAKLVPYDGAEKPRVLGLLKGQILEAADCWEPDQELEASIDLPCDLPLGPSAAVITAFQNIPAGSPKLQRAKPSAGASRGARVAETGPDVDPETGPEAP